MREGAWINSLTGAYCWVNDHAVWLQRPGNAAALGLPDTVIEELGLPLLGVTGSSRKTILLAAMGHGLVRVRGHGNSVTFESTLPWVQAIMGSLRFMDENLGPAMLCRFNDLMTGNSVEFFFDQARERLGSRAQ